MPKYKNVSGQAVHVAALGNRLVTEGGVIEVPDEVLEYTSFTNDNWQPVGKEAKGTAAEETPEG